MKRFLALIAVLAIILVGCAPKTPEVPPIDEPPVITSDDFVTVYSGELTTLNYLVTGTTAEQAVAANTVDGLVEYDNLGIVQPSLATSWTTSADGLVWTFTLREGSMWMTHEGEEYAEVVAEDFVSSAKYLLNQENASRTANIVYGAVAGAKAYYDGETTDFSTVGIKATDKYTVEYTLLHPIPYFLSMLTYVCFLPVNGEFLAEAGERFGTDHTTLLANGSYILENFEPQNVREYVKNPAYWDADNVHIGRLTYRYNAEAGQLAPELFARGEISSVVLPVSVLDGWLEDDSRKDWVSPANTSFYAYWYAFNFDAQFEPEYEPENWMVAVNNENFRKSIAHGLDRIGALLTQDPYEPERRLSNTITPKNFVAVAGVDYTQLPALASYTNGDSFDADKAIEHRDLARTELEGAATFPIIVKMPYSTGSNDWTNRVQVIEQQLEALLGEDFIDIVPAPYPATGFLNATRRAFNYALQEVNWGPDYADPETYSEPFWPGNTYSEISSAAGLEGVYEALIESARNELTDVERRYQLFAEAEAHLIEHALVIPYSIGGGGYQATKIDPFAPAYAPFGISNLKFKFQVVYDQPITTDEYFSAKEKWESDRADALQSSGQ